MTEAVCRCLLLRGSAMNETTRARLALMRETNDGFRLAEEDLRLRGAGDFLGRRQSGEEGYRIATPEMLSYFSQELAENARNGVRNEISNVKLLQGDVSEAWREGGTVYATVAMRYSLVDAMVDRATKRVVKGDPSRSTEATELWTFRKDDRAASEGWQLSAIQQAA